jgi:hypothetical protein
MKTQQRVAAMPRPWTSLALSGPGSNRRREVVTLLGAAVARLVTSRIGAHATDRGPVRLAIFGASGLTVAPGDGAGDALPEETTR